MHGLAIPKITVVEIPLLSIMGYNQSRPIGINEIKGVH